MQVGLLDYSTIAIYFVFVLAIGVTLKRQMVSSEDFFLSGRSIPSWITGLSFISATGSARGSSADDVHRLQHYILVIPCSMLVGVKSKLSKK